MFQKRQETQHYKHRRHADAFVVDRSAQRDECRRAPESERQEERPAYIDRQLLEIALANHAIDSQEGQ